MKRVAVAGTIAFLVLIVAGGPWSIAQEADDPFGQPAVPAAPAAAEPEPAEPVAPAAAEPEPAEPEPATPERSPAELLEAAASGEVEARCDAIAALGDLLKQGVEIPGAKAALAGLLKDPSAEVRAQAAVALGRMGAEAKDAVAALAELVADDDPTVRRAALAAWGQIRPGPEVSIPLFVRMMEDAEASVRLRAIHALAEFGPEAVPALVEALKNKEAAYWAALALAEIGPDAADAVEPLVELARSDDRSEVKAEAFLALGAVGAAAAPAVPELLKAIDDEDTTVHLAATYALGLIGPEARQAGFPLRAKLDTVTGMEKLVTAWALAKIYPQSEKWQLYTTVTLARALASPVEGERVAAARGLADLRPGPDLAIPAIQAALRDAPAEVVDGALDAMADLGDAAVPPLIEALRHEEVRAKAAAILARIGPPAKAAVPALAALLKDEQAETRREALFALGEIGPDSKPALPAIAAALDDADEKVAYAACYALGKIGPDAMDAKPALQKMLDAEDEFLRVAAAWALARVHPECPETPLKSVPLLIEALDEPAPMIRLEAIESLRCLGPRAKDAVPALEKAAEDENETIRQAAAEALKAIGG
jgi:HEAT repeat protein